MAKKLLINCGHCDARNVTEETLAAYDSIHINCGGMFLNPEARALMARYGVSMNCGNIKEVDKDVKLRQINGCAQIKSSDALADRCYLHVNGTLEIGPDTEKVLEQYVGISVNGTVTYPDSVGAYLGMMKVNGTTTCYPDGAIILKRNAVIDKLFALRAKQSLYWSAKRMIMVDPQLDAKKLEQKGVRFSTDEVIIAESKVEEMIGLIDDKAKIVIVPDGTAVTLDDVELDDLTVKKYGTKLYIIGDLTVREAGAEALGQLAYLYVRGDILVEEGAKEKLMDAVTEFSGDIQIIKAPKGRRIEDKANLRISKWLLEQEPDGIWIQDCVQVILDEDIPRELILERLHISDCEKVWCSPEQETAVVLVSEDVGMISSQPDAESNANREDQRDTKVINAGDYVL